MLGNRTSEQWIAQYSTSHQHPVNRLCHTFGIPRQDEDLDYLKICVAPSQIPAS